MWMGFFATRNVTRQMPTARLARVAQAGDGAERRRYWSLVLLRHSPRKPWHSGWPDR